MKNLITQKILASSKKFDGFVISVSRGMLLVVPLFVLFACFNLVYAQPICTSTNCFSVSAVTSSGSSCGGACLGHDCSVCVDVTVCVLCNYEKVASWTISNTSECFTVCPSDAGTS